MSREVMQQALDALEMQIHGAGSIIHSKMAWDALKAELAKPEPEPVVWMQSNHLDKFEQHACGADSMHARCSHRKLQPDYIPLYHKEET